MAALFRKQRRGTYEGRGVGSTEGLGEGESVGTALGVAVEGTLRYRHECGGAEGNVMKIDQPIPQGVTTGGNVSKWGLLYCKGGGGCSLSPHVNKPRRRA